MRHTLLNWYNFKKMKCTYFCGTDESEKCTLFYETEGIFFSIHYNHLIYISTLVNQLQALPSNLEKIYIKQGWFLFVSLCELCHPPVTQHSTQIFNWKNPQFPVSDNVAKFYKVFNPLHIRALQQWVRNCKGILCLSVC